MQYRAALCALLFGVAAGASQQDQSNPLGQVLSLLSDLSAKVKSEGAAEDKTYAEYVAWCTDVKRNGGFEIQTATSQKEKLEATIAELGSNIEASASKIGSLAADIQTGDSDLKGATAIREKERSDFAASEKELVEAIDTLGRAVNILEREMQKNPAALAQVNNKNMAAVVQSLTSVVNAAAFSAVDKDRLMALVQSQQSVDDEDGDLAESLGAPAAVVYKSHSSNIFDVLEDLKEKAEAQLSDLRKAETNAGHNYNMLKQSLEDQLAADNMDMDAEKSRKASAEENKAIAEGDLSVATADLKTAKEALASAETNCATVAADHEASLKSRGEELKAISEAMDILKSTSSGAVSQTYSLIQVSMRTHADLAQSEVVALVKHLAREQHSAALAQLASRLAAVVRYGAASGEGPFVKVRGLIQDMIAKLEAQAASEATEKAYCDDELSKTAEKKSELSNDISKLSTSIDKAAARSTALKADVKELQAELATLSKEQAENVQWRSDAHADYVQAKADLELGLSGVRKALVVLKDYYAQDAAGAALLQQPVVPQHEQATGAGTSIIGILEVVEADFADNLAKEETAEATAQDAFDQATQEYKLTKAKKEQDVKYKTQEFVGLDKNIAALSSDRETANTELAAVMEYDAKLKERCIAKPETYSERSRRREAEIKGLKEALTILEGEALVQRNGKSRGGRHHRGFLMAATHSM